MSKRTAYLISCSDHYGHRLSVIDDYLRSRGFDTIYITSDFDHATKKVFVCNVPNCVQIHVLPYRKNLSVDRIVSHWQFARAVARYLKQVEQKADAVICLLPPNFLAFYLARYKKRNPEVKLIFDIFDMWPETFPVGKLKKLLSPVFHVWAKLRDASLPAADFVTTECDFFRELLHLPDEKSATVHLCAEPLSVEQMDPELSDEKIQLCYLGAINNVIGISEICQLIQQLSASKPVKLHIIGSGEREQEFVASAENAGAEVVYYGAIYDDARKQEIIHKCHFGLNIITSTACIGLTMKSVEYFRHGLPIISNIPADTEKLLAQYDVGIQLDQECIYKVLNMSTERILTMRQNVKKVFAEKFDETVILQQYKHIFKDMGEFGD